VAEGAIAPPPPGDKAPGVGARASGGWYWCCWCLWWRGTPCWCLWWCGKRGRWGCGCGGGGAAFCFFFFCLFATFAPTFLGGASGPSGSTSDSMWRALRAVRIRMNKKRWVRLCFEELPRPCWRRTSFFLSLPSRSCRPRRPARALSLSLRPAASEKCSSRPKNIVF
jgi:hypothetical protein